MNRLALLLFAAPLAAAELAPWFPPPWEFQGRAHYLYSDQDLIETPLGSFNLPNPVNFASFALNLTPWPQWNTEAELLLGTNPASNVSFSYRALRLTGRYQWFDDTTGDPFSLVTGGTFFTVPNRFLTATGTWFHGNLNGELHLAIGKEFTCDYEWWSRLWMYLGYGVADRGNPWWHASWSWDQRLCTPLIATFDIEMLYGMGSNDIDPLEPFPGYAGLDHHSVNIALNLAYTLFPWGTATLNSWYNVHAYNAPKGQYGVGATFCLPFSF